MNNNIELSDTALLSELDKRLNQKTKVLKSQTEMIDKMRELNVRLRDSEKVKSNFLSNVRNEINNPLSSIIGFAQQLVLGQEFDERTIKRIGGLIGQEALSLDFQLKNIFAAAEIEAGEAHPKPAAVDVEELIRDQLYYFTDRAFRRRVELNFEKGKGNPTFVTDPYMLKCIVMNLVANAIEFSKQGEGVNIKSEVANDVLTVSVRDYGKGIDEADYKHIFDRFRQSEFGSTKNHQGHGLGLSIVKEFVDSMHGELQIESGVGMGTLIQVTLPAISQQHAADDFSSGNDILFDNEEIF